MSDKELLFLAAKALGIEVWNGYKHQSDMLFTNTKPDTNGICTGVEWNPLNNDSDAFGLMVGLRIIVDFEYTLATASDGTFTKNEYYHNHDYDDKKAARYAIVGCAAKIGRL